MHILTLLEKKRDHLELDGNEIRFFIEQISLGNIPDYQASAMLMAIAINGMTARETADLTHAMTVSGKTIDLEHIPGPKADKHSTGGVGDKVSLILAPLAAAAGIKVPMISGRSLGHTGGTLDKLEAIPGFRTHISNDEFIRNVNDIGLCIMGQTENLVPADKVLYALRDTTATVPSVPLITSSILSKKLAEGINSLVLDIKVGSGGFMSTVEQAESLARAMIHTANLNNLPMTVVLSDMDQPLGNTAGNWIEVTESMDVLNGKGPRDLKHLSLVLTSHMLVMSGLATHVDQAYTRLEALLANGSAYRKFIDMVQQQGGDEAFLENPDDRYHTQHNIEVPSPQNGYITAMQTRKLGEILTRLGGGRQHKADVIDPAAGLNFHVKKGDHIKKAEPLLTVYTNKLPNNLVEDIQACYSIGPEKPAALPLIIKTVTGDS